MEEVLAGLAANGQAAGAIGTGFQAALHRLADAQVFILDASTDGDALLVVLAAGVAHVGEIEVEDDAAVIDIDGSM